MTHIMGKLTSAYVDLDHALRDLSGQQKQIDLESARSRIKGAQYQIMAARRLLPMAIAIAKASQKKDGA